MKFFQQILSIIMAITIASPVCCCASIDSTHASNTPTKNSCCSSSQGSEKSDEDSPSKDSHNCPCADTPSNLSHEKQDLVSPQPIDFTPLPQTNLSAELTPHITELRLDPPSYIPPPKRLTTLFQRFLI